jgi:hypothetical protein
MPERISSGDQRTLAADLFEKYREQVVGRLKAAYPKADMDQRHDAFVQALLELVRKSDQLDPSRGDWLKFLTGAARRILRKRVGSDDSRRRREWERGKDVVAEQESAAREIVDVLADAELLKKAATELAQTDQERTMLAHWGEDFREVAQALALTDLLEAEQQGRVRTLRNRLEKRLKRWKGKP